MREKSGNVSHKYTGYTIDPSILKVLMSAQSYFKHISELNSLFLSIFKLLWDSYDIGTDIMRIKGSAQIPKIKWGKSVVKDFFSHSEMLTAFQNLM